MSSWQELLHPVVPGGGIHAEQEMHSHDQCILQNNWRSQHKKHPYWQWRNRWWNSKRVVVSQMRREDEIVILKTGTPTCPLFISEDWNYSTTQILETLYSNWYLRYLLWKGSYLEPPSQLYIGFIACQSNSIPSTTYRPSSPSAGESCPRVLSFQARSHTGPSGSRSGCRGRELAKVCELAHPVRERARVVYRSEHIHATATPPDYHPQYHPKTFYCSEPCLLTRFFIFQHA